MTTATIGAMVYIPLKTLPEGGLEHLKRNLTLRRKQSSSFSFGKNKSDSDLVFFYTMTDKGIFLPRKLGIEYCLSNRIQTDDIRSDGTAIQVEFNEAEQSKKPDLKVRQDGIVDDVTLGLKRAPFHSGLLQAGTGTGKTVCGVKLICKMGRTALIIVHNEFLMEQWLYHLIGWPNGRLGFTDLKKEDVGFLQQDQKEIFGKKVVIGMIQTIIRRNFSNEERKAFGLLLADEVQHVPAEAFSQVLTKFDARCVVGLSATPNRFDGLDSLLLASLGGTLNKDVIEPQLVPDVFVVKHPTQIPENLYMQAVRNPDGSMTRMAHLGKLVVCLIKIPARNRMILDYTIRAAKADRKIMVFSSRIRHLEGMKTEFDKKMPGRSSLFIGGLTGPEREEAKKAQVIFCTIQFAAEALDIPNRDCLILGTPVSFIGQAMGRILRSDDGKKNPVVIDIVDSGVKKLQAMASNRAREYKRVRARIHMPSGQTLS